MGALRRRRVHPAQQPSRGVRAMSQWWTYHPCDVCHKVRRLSQLRSIGDGRVVCLNDHPDVLPIGENGQMPTIPPEVTELLEQAYEGTVDLDRITDVHVVDGKVVF